jgi:response regulator RpfG family c-di-GMP phosphodiesterase
MPQAQARQELTRCAGTQLDPQVVEALLAELAQLNRVHLDAGAVPDTSSSVLVSK